jgi:hypothetical protein
VRDRAGSAGTGSRCARDRGSDDGRRRSRAGRVPEWQHPAPCH